MTKNESLELALALIQKHLDEYLMAHPNNDETNEWMIKQHKDAIEWLEKLKDK